MSTHPNQTDWTESQSSSSLSGLPTPKEGIVIVLLGQTTAKVNTTT